MDFSRVNQAGMKEFTRLGQRAIHSMPLRSMGRQMHEGRNLTADQMQIVLRNQAKYTKDEVRILKQMAIRARQQGAIGSDQFCRSMKILNGGKTSAEDVRRAMLTSSKEADLENFAGFAVSNLDTMSTKDASILLTGACRFLKRIIR